MILTTEILRIVRKNRQIFISPAPLTGKAPCPYIIGIDYILGKIYLVSATRDWVLFDSGFSNSPLQVFNSNEAALLGSLVSGDRYLLPFNGSYVLAYVVGGNTSPGGALLNEDGTILLNQDGTPLLI